LYGRAVLGHIDTVVDVPGLNFPLLTPNGSVLAPISQGRKWGWRGMARDGGIVDRENDWEDELQAVRCVPWED
jgi:hypothetical protein